MLLFEMFSATAKLILRTQQLVLPFGEYESSVSSLWAHLCIEVAICGHTGSHTYAQSRGLESDRMESAGKQEAARRQAPGG